MHMRWRGNPVTDKFYIILVLVRQPCNKLPLSFKTQISRLGWFNGSLLTLRGKLLGAVLLFISNMWNHLAFDVISLWLLYNYRLLMRSTRYHVDRVWYWLTDAVGGGQPIPDKVYMVPSRPKSKVYNCFIKLSGILQENDFTYKRNAHDVVRRKQIRREMDAYIVTS